MIFSLHLPTELVQTGREEIELLQLIGNDSLMGSSLQHDVPQPSRIGLVWAHWRYNQAFTTVSSTLNILSFKSDQILQWIVTHH